MICASSKAWWPRVRQALSRFVEDNVRAHANADYGWDAAVRAIYVSCYRSRRHGPRDDRPQHWRKYLERGPEPR